jgi:UDP-N-acetylglucosamine 4,6-dehydratase
MATFLITGGTGSLGTALAQHLLGEGHNVRAYARNEHSHELLERAIPEPSRVRLSCTIGDVLDVDRLKLALSGCDYLIHAAAAKVIPLCEYSPIEAIHTNVDGTINAALAVIATPSVKRAVFISTDKACSPATLYGATKLCGERLWLRANNYRPMAKPFVAVRYGNVFGSNGSVVRIWREALAAGQPISVTEPSATRFHLRLDEAVKLVLRVLHEAAPGELWVPKLRTYKVGDLASVFSPRCDRVGIRPGEKLHESMVSEHESIDARDEGDHYVLTPGIHQGSGGWTFHSGRPELLMSREAVRKEVEAWELSSSPNARAPGVSATTTWRTPTASSVL